MKRTLKDFLTEIEKGTGPSLILLHGDDFHLHEAAKSLLSALVPEDQRAFALEPFDGRFASWDQIESVLRTPSLLPGKKTVFVENAPYFLSRERKGELADKVVQLWSEEKKDEAARLLLDLMALEGWSQNPNENDRKGPPNRGSGKGRPAEMDEILAYCLSRGMDPAKHRTPQDHRLLDLLEEGIPSWVVLLISASHVDKRTRLYRRVEQEGAVLDLSLERERSGRIKKDNLVEFFDRQVRARRSSQRPVICSWRGPVMNYGGFIRKLRNCCCTWGISLGFGPQTSMRYFPTKLGPGSLT